MKKILILLSLLIITLFVISCTTGEAFRPRVKDWNKYQFQQQIPTQEQLKKPIIMERQFPTPTYCLEPYYHKVNEVPTDFCIQQTKTSYDYINLSPKNGYICVANEFSEEKKANACPEGTKFFNVNITQAYICKSDKPFEFSKCLDGYDLVENYSKLKPKDKFNITKNDEYNIMCKLPVKYVYVYQLKTLGACGNSGAELVGIGANNAHDYCCSK